MKEGLNLANRYSAGRKDKREEAKGAGDGRKASGGSYSLGLRIGALVLAGVLIFGTLIVTAIYM